MKPFNMPPAMMGSSMGNDETSLLSILINLLFGFVGGLMIFLGPAQVLAYGSKLAGEIIALTGYGQQMALFGVATTAAPYVIIAPIIGMVLKQLSSVRTLKSFAFFAVAVLIGIAGAYFGQGLFVSVVS